VHSGWAATGGSTKIVRQNPKTIYMNQAKRHASYNNQNNKNNNNNMRINNKNNN